MKRRVVKVGECRYRVELPGGDLSEFSYREKPRKWNPDLCSYVDFEPDEDRYILSWEGLFMDTFLKEQEVLLFIMRFGYSIPDEDLVPSEILTDVNLVYEAGDWVDEWGCPDQHDVIFAIGDIQRPPERNIRFEGYPRITPKKREGWYEGTWIDKHGVSRSYYGPSYRRRDDEIVAEIKIPELDFEELEKPKRRRRTISRDWGDPSECAYGGWGKLRKPDGEQRPEEECVFTLKIGKAAEKEHQARKKRSIPLQK
jgi:hypothetical protein